MYSLVGLPALRSDMSYVGHLINDGARLQGLGGAEMRLLVPRYVDESGSRRNAGHETVAGCHTVTLATRDVARGEELLATYGPRYWMSALRRRNDRIAQAVAGFL